MAKKYLIEYGFLKEVDVVKETDRTLTIKEEGLRERRLLKAAGEVAFETPREAVANQKVLLEKHIEKLENQIKGVKMKWETYNAMCLKSDDELVEIFRGGKHAAVVR